jgi:acyl carrier protein
MTLKNDVRQILVEHGKLAVDVSTLADGSNLYDAGMTSLTTVNVMLAIEDHFDIEFEDEMLARATFESIESLADAIDTLRDN